MPHRPGKRLGHGLDVGTLTAQQYVRLTDAELPQELTGQPGMLPCINQIERLAAFLELLKDGRHLDELRFCADKDMNHGYAESISPKILARFFRSSSPSRSSSGMGKSIKSIAFTSFKSHLADLLRHKSDHENGH